MRKIITPTFHFSILQGYIDIFNKNAKTLLKVLEDVNKEDCDLAKPVTYCALDNVCGKYVRILLLYAQLQRP